MTAAEPATFLPLPAGPREDDDDTVVENVTLPPNFFTSISPASDFERDVLPAAMRAVDAGDFASAGLALLEYNKMHHSPAPTSLTAAAVARFSAIGCSAPKCCPPKETQQGAGAPLADTAQRKAAASQDGTPPSLTFLSHEEPPSDAPRGSPPMLHFRLLPDDEEEEMAADESLPEEHHPRHEQQQQRELQMEEDELEHERDHLSKRRRCESSGSPAVAVAATTAAETTVPRDEFIYNTTYTDLELAGINVNQQYLPCYSFADRGTITATGLASLVLLFSLRRLHPPVFWALQPLLPPEPEVLRLATDNAPAHKKEVTALFRRLTAPYLPSSLVPPPSAAALPPTLSAFRTCDFTADADAASSSSSSSSSSDDEDEVAELSAHTAEATPAAAITPPREKKAHVKKNGAPRRVRIPQKHPSFVFTTVGCTCWRRDLKRAAAVHVWLRRTSSSSSS
eukprot:TRINITY_DN2260_c0_g1_i2.p2 TRINITY_DN2260_c0_g1~~TRINITY_DN2260_c0_g1_i2.p2  ORF type:complete len:454 (-),score=131.17 TRINITY_DN2260_c0_g1_i2:2703-4064(-)